MNGFVNHVELRSILLEITQINDRIRKLTKEVKNSPIQVELKQLKTKKSTLTQKCELYMRTNKLEHVHTVIPPAHEQQPTNTPKPTKTSVKFVTKPQHKFSLDDLEELLTEYYRSRGIQDETESIIRYLEQYGPSQTKLHVQSRVISNVKQHTNQEGNV